MKIHKVVIVEDHTLLSQAIAGVVDRFENFKVIYQCKNGQELIEKFDADKSNIPDLVLMDIIMPIMNGIETTQWITDNYPNIHVLALSVEADEQIILQMLKSGAKGYLLKDTEKTILNHALIEVMNNGYYHTKIVTDILLKSALGKNITSNNLKENEIQFMKLICTEMTYKEIASQMCLSPKTIDGYRDALFQKLNVKNRIGLVMYAIKNKIYIV